MSTHVTQDFISFIMKDRLPGCRLKTKKRLGGVTLSMAVWHYELSISLNLTQVAISDKLGEAVMTWTYLPKELMSEKAANKIILRRAFTTDPEKVTEFVDGVKAYLKGINLAINTAMNQHEEREANIFFDGYGDD